MAATLMVTSSAAAEAAEEAVLEAVELAAPPQAARLSAAAPTPATFRKLRREMRSIMCFLHYLVSFKHSRGKQALPGRAVCFSVSNISFFAFLNKGFVVSFFRNLALWNFLSAKSLNSRGCFGQVALACNFFDTFKSFSGTKNRGPTEKQGLLFSHFPSIMEKSPRGIVSF